MSETRRHERITYAKPLLWNAPRRVRWRAWVFVAWLRFRCARNGCEWRDELVTRRVTVTACRNCGRFIGSHVDREESQ